MASVRNVKDSKHIHVLLSFVSTVPAFCPVVRILAPIFASLAKIKDRNWFMSAVDWYQECRGVQIRKDRIWK